METLIQEMFGSTIPASGCYICIRQARPSIIHWMFQYSMIFHDYCKKRDASVDNSQSVEAKMAEWKRVLDEVVEKSLEHYITANDLHQHITGHMKVFTKNGFGENTPSILIKNSRSLAGKYPWDKGFPAFISTYPIRIIN